MAILLLDSVMDSQTELNVFIERVQDPVDGDVNDGGSWYKQINDYSKEGVNILKTGNLIFEMAFLSESQVTQRVNYALNYLSRHWNDHSGIESNSTPGWNGDPTHIEAMFSVKVGLEYMEIE